MKITFTSVAWTDVNAIFPKALKPLEFLANNLFLNKSYGADISQFAAVAIAVGEPEENEKFSKPHNKAGTDKHPLTGEKAKFISFALCFTQDEVLNKDEDKLKHLFCNALLARLDNPNIKLPKGFDYEKFSTDMKYAVSSVFTL